MSQRRTQRGSNFPDRREPEQFGLAPDQVFFVVYSFLEECYISLLPKLNIFIRLQRVKIIVANVRQSQPRSEAVKSGYKLREH